METATRVAAPDAAFSRLIAAAMPTPATRAAAKVFITCKAAAPLPKLANFAAVAPLLVSNGQWANLAKLNAAGAGAVQNMIVARKLADPCAGLLANLTREAKMAVFVDMPAHRATAAPKGIFATGPGFDVAAWGWQPRPTPAAKPTPPATPTPAAPAVPVVAASPVANRPAVAPLPMLTPANDSAPLPRLRDGVSGGELADLLAAVVGLNGAPADLHRLLDTGLPARPLTWGNRFALLDPLLVAYGCGPRQRQEIARCLADAAGPAGGPWVGWGGPVATDAPSATPAPAPAPEPPAPVAGVWVAVLTNGFALSELDRLLVFVGLLDSTENKTVTPESKPAQWVAVREALKETNCINKNNRAWARAIRARYGERVGQQRALESSQNHGNDAANHCYQRAKILLTGRQRGQ